jgi:hypothetical protein
MTAGRSIAAVIAGLVVIAGAGGGGYLLGRHSHRDGSQRQTAVADALEVIGAYNINGSGAEFHLVWVRQAAPGIWRFLAKENGKNNYACVQVTPRQFWHGQGTAFHGVGNVDIRRCRPGKSS